MREMRQISLIILVSIFLIGQGCKKTEEEPEAVLKVEVEDVNHARRPHLSANELLELYESMYSSIHNMHFSFTNMLEKLEKNEEFSSPKRGQYTRWQTCERIQEGQKYYVRDSSAPDGFAHLNSIMEIAFDGSATSSYSPPIKAGSIYPGKRGYG